MILPFCTHGGSRFGSSISTREEFCSDSVIVDGYETSGSLTDGDVNEIQTEQIQTGETDSQSVEEADMAEPEKNGGYAE